jgi:hypothetical protein
MSKIYELFGFRLDNWSAEAESNCAKAWCPFMNAACDGGGNRYLSAIDLRNHPKLAAKFPGIKIVQAGVCSLRVRNHDQPWIVCPRRLLSLRERLHGADYQKYVKNQLANYMNLASGKVYRVWAEVKMKVGTTSVDDQEKSFDYSFDYVIADTTRVRLSEAAKIIGSTERTTKSIAEKNGFTLAKRGELWIDDFPADPIVIVEIMTSSTSGGDKNKRTQIAMAFEDAILDRNNHNGPGINYRQVWARMVSQLIVKSQVGIAWKGKTIWLIQDVLADYISSTTALDLSKYLNSHPDEVNILAFGYSDISQTSSDNKVISLQESNFYAGPIVNKEPVKDNHGSGFVDIVKIGAPPPKDQLCRSLFLKSAYANFSV